MAVFRPARATIHTSKVKFGEQEYAVGSLAHAKFGHDGRMEVVGQKIIKLKIVKFKFGAFFRLSYSLRFPHLFPIDAKTF